MTTDEIIRLVFSFLGGGLIVFILDWFRIARSEKRERKRSFLQNQIQNLYGPLQFFASQNESYFELNERFLSAYSEHYEGKKWSQDKTTQTSLKEETEQVLNIANEYVGLVRFNNDKIYEVLQNNYSLIDANDIITLQQYLVDYIRMKIEWDKDSGKLKTPFLIYKSVGEISFMRPDFIRMIKEQFENKRKELDSFN
jgi:hypothetical protein